MIPLFKPYMPETVKGIEKLLFSGNLSYGDYARQFEDALAAYFNTSYVLALNSFQTAIHIMLTAFEMQPGDEVIASPMGCLVSTQPYVTYGLKVSWADIDPETGTLDPLAVERKLTAKTKMIVHNHFCGYPGYIDEMNDIGKANNVIVVDDGIECFGSLYKNKKIGNCGSDATIFSFNPVRVPNTVEGGAIIFRERETFDRALLIADSGIDRERFRLKDGEINPRCDIKLKGYNAKMSNVNGFIGVHQMKEVDKLIDKQRQNAERWKNKLSDFSVKTLSKTHIQNNPNYWVYGMLAKEKKKAIKAFREQGYYASSVHINNNIYSVFENKEKLEGVECFKEHFLAVPCGWWAEI